MAIVISNLFCYGTRHLQMACQNPYPENQLWKK